MKLPKPLFMRALAVTFGSVIAVIPLLVIRLLIVIGAEGLQLDIGGWTRLFYLPYELIFPFWLSSKTLYKHPRVTSASLAGKTLLYSIASSPFVVTVFTLLVTLDATGDKSFFTTLATILGLTPFIGTLGLIGFLFICFPLTLFGGAVAWGGDYLVQSKFRRELETIQFEKEFQARALSLGQRLKLGWSRIKQRLSRKKPVFNHYSEVQLKDEFSRYRSPVFDRLSAIDRHLSSLEHIPGRQFNTQRYETLLKRIRQQLLLIEQKTLSFHELLKQRLNVEELTFYRYSGSVKNVYYSVMSQLDTVSKNLLLEIETNSAQPQTETQQALLTSNESAINSIDEIVEAIKTLPELSQNTTSLSQSMSQLEEMIKRVGDYHR